MGIKKKKKKETDGDKRVISNKYYTCVTKRKYFVGMGVPNLPLHQGRITRHMVSGIKGLKGARIRDHSPGIWNHNACDRDQQSFSWNQRSHVKFCALKYYTSFEHTVFRRVKNGNFDSYDLFLIWLLVN